MNKFEQQYKEIINSDEGDHKMRFKEIADEMKDRLERMGIKLARQSGPITTIREHAKDTLNRTRRSRGKKMLTSFREGEYAEVYPT